MNRRLKDILLFFFLVTLMIQRWMAGEDNAPWVGTVVCMGVLVAAGDLLVECCSRYYKRKRMGLLLLAATGIGIILVGVISSVFTEKIMLNNRSMDMLTLVTLLISLSHSLYLDIVGMILTKTEEDRTK